MLYMYHIYIYIYIYMKQCCILPQHCFMRNGGIFGECHVFVMHYKGRVCSNVEDMTNTCAYTLNSHSDLVRWNTPSPPIKSFPIKSP